MENSKAKLHANLNPHRTVTNKAPSFVGTLDLGNNGPTRELLLWVHKDRNGHAMLMGKAAESAVEQIQNIAEGKPVYSDPSDLSHAKTTGSQFVIDPYDVVLTFNTGKTESRHPDWRGYFNPGPNHPLMAVSVWANSDAQGRAMLSGTLRPHGQGPTMLPVVTIEGEAYFNDARLQELRSVDNPHVKIPYDDLQAQDSSLYYGIPLPKRETGRSKKKSTTRNR